MKIIATTERLRLREMTPDDAANAYALNADPEVVRYTGDEPFPSIEAAWEFLQNYSDYRRNGYGRWAVEKLPDGTFIGWCGLKKLDGGDVDLGYRLMREHWGKGYATEAARECLRIGFQDLGLDEIIGRTAQENIGSVRVLEKLGMNYYKTEQCFHDPVALYFKIGRDQWRAVHPTL
jgi:RimJ/RimL family protein N-acetyltransferase